jgi:hypothetical protein
MFQVQRLLEAVEQALAIAENHWRDRDLVRSERGQSAPVTLIWCDTAGSHFIPPLNDAV